MALPHSMIGVKAVSYVCGFAGSDCLAEAFEPAKKNQLATISNVSLPSPSLVVSPDPYKTRGVANRLGEIARVFRLGYIAKVANSIVRPIAVYVINLAFGGRAVSPQPNYALRGNSAPTKFAFFIPVAVYRGERLATRVAGVKHPRFLLAASLPRIKVVRQGIIPCQFARAWVIIKKTPNLLRIHSGLLRLILGRNTYEGATQCALTP